MALIFTALVATLLGFALATLRQRRLLRRTHADLLSATARAQALEAQLQQQTSAAVAEKLRNRELWQQREAERQLLDITDAANQLRFVQTSTLAASRLLNHEEEIVFNATLRIVAQQNQARLNRPGRRLAVAVQVNMGQFLSTPGPASEDNDRAHRSINSKRVDFLVFSRTDLKPVLAIEHQGSGHAQGNYKARDAVKRAALLRAGVPLLETTTTHLPSLLAQINTALSPSSPAEAVPSI